MSIPTSVAAVNRLGLQIQLLGGAYLHLETKSYRLERRPAALLALLALEGELSRSYAAGLLWPDRDETRARANLRQLLFRLRKQVGVDLVELVNQQQERLLLKPGLQLDLLSGPLELTAGPWANTGELLQQFEFDDCPEFSEWLEVQRERLARERSQAYQRALEDPHQPQAEAWARAWLQLDPLCEAAHCALARVYAVRGEVGAAVRTLGELTSLLERELGVSPGAEARELLRELEAAGQSAGGLDSVPAGQTPGPVPFKPTQLVGRQGVWRELQAAWGAGQGLVVSGPPGQGKTRLLLDFLPTVTCFDQLLGRPGDEDVPLSSLTRYLRSLPLDLGPQQDWVKTELSRLLPELGSAPPPMLHETDKIRLYEALWLVLEQRLRGGVETLFIDDLQYLDVGSFEALNFLSTRAQTSGLRLVIAYRSAELPESWAQLLARQVERGFLHAVALQPLVQTDIAELFEAGQVPGAAALVSALQASTGGNPLYLLETLRLMSEQPGGRDGPLLPLTEHITQQRLESRSLQAQQLAQLAAVAGQDFTVELAARVQGQDAMGLLLAVQELEEAQLMHGERFQHDLLQEAVYRGLGASLRRFLHRRCAECLPEHSDPVRRAEHWIAGGLPEEAVPYLLRAATHSGQQLQVIGAIRLLLKAADILEAAGQQGQAFDAYFEARMVGIYFGHGELKRRSIEGMVRTAATSEQQLKAIHAQAAYYNATNQPQRAIESVQQLAGLVSNQQLLELSPFVGHLEAALSQAYRLLSDTERSLQHAERAVQSADQAVARLEERADRGQLNQFKMIRCMASTTLSMSLAAVGRYREAEQSFERCLREARALQAAFLHGTVYLIAHYAEILADQGDYLRAQVLAAEALLEARGYRETHSPFAISILLISARIALYLGQPWEAQQLARDAGLACEQTGEARLAVAQAFEALAWQALGEPSRAEGLLRAVVITPETYTLSQHQVLLARAQLCLEHGPLDQELSATLEHLARETPFVVSRLGARLLLSGRRAALQVRRELAQQVLDEAHEHRLFGYQIAALGRLALIYLELEAPQEALQQTWRVLALLERYASELPRSEVDWAHYRALQVLGNRAEALAHLRGWWASQQASAAQVPAQYRDGLSRAGATQQALWAQARAAGLLEPEGHCSAAR